MSVQGKHVVVSGGGSGVGAELARQFRVSGGNIKNIAVAAAYGAAANGGVVDGAHVLHAARREHQKIGRRLHLSEFDETATGSRG